MGQFFFLALLLLTTFFTNQINGMQQIITKTFAKHKELVQKIIPFNNDTVLSLSSKKFLLWDAKQRQNKNIIIGMESKLDNIQLDDVQKFNDDNIISISRRGTVKIWNIKNNNFHSFKNKEKKIYGAGNINKLDDQTIFVHKQGVFYLWNVIKKKFITKFGRKYNSEAYENKNGFFKLDQNKIISLYGSNLYLWDIRQKKRAHTFSGYEGNGHFASIDSVCKINEAKFLSTDESNIIKLWDVQEKKCMQTFSGHKDHIKKLIHLDKNRLACASATEIALWQTDTGEGWYLHRSKNYDIETIEKIDDTKIVSGHSDGTLKIWDLGQGDIWELETNRPIETKKIHENPIKNICVHPQKIILSSCHASSYLPAGLQSNYEEKKIKLNYLS